MANWVSFDRQQRMSASAIRQRSLTFFYCCIISSTTRGFESIIIWSNLLYYRFQKFENDRSRILVDGGRRKLNPIFHWSFTRCHFNQIWNSKNFFRANLMCDTEYSVKKRLRCLWQGSVPNGYCVKETIWSRNEF